MRAFIKSREGLDSPDALIALQGGGALGAFTWGVIDHLLEDGRLTFVRVRELQGPTGAA